MYHYVPEIPANYLYLQTTFRYFIFINYSISCLFVGLSKLHSKSVVPCKLLERTQLQNAKSPSVLPTSTVYGFIAFRSVMHLLMMCLQLHLFFLLESIHSSVLLASAWWSVGLRSIFVSDDVYRCWVFSDKNISNVDIIGNKLCWMCH